MRREPYIIGTITLGIKYAAIGTNRILYVYSGGSYYDIHPIRETLTGAKFTSSSSSTTVTVVCTGAHGLLEDDIVLFDSVTGVTGSSTYTNATFEDIKYMVTSVPIRYNFYNYRSKHRIRNSLNYK